MGEVSNKTLALLVLAALVVVVVATTVQLSKLNQFGVAGFATTDTGDVNLTIASALQIEVDATFDTIDFGTCTPNGTRGTYVVDSNDTTGDGDCTGDTATPQRIQVNNIGNEDANVTVRGECTVQEFLPTQSGSGSDFELGTYGAGCAGTALAYTTVTTSDIVACSNLTISDSFNTSARITIPADTRATQSGSCSDGRNTLTFTAAIA